MTYFEMAKRAKQLAAQILSEDKVYILFTETDRYTDGEVAFFLSETELGGYSIFVIEGAGKQVGYQISKYFGSPLATQFHTNVGEPYKNLDDAIKSVLLLVTENALNSLIEKEAMEAALIDNVSRE